ncbi:MAG: 4Fe-4S dicluster domain-containing protein [Candidatus Magnetoovum sp. WYHC-5]|nr:4Fe-4S dicluster domain-containing protein [Candidatus Magnetoovum sp. WYHC-5]
MDRRKFIKSMAVGAAATAVPLNQSDASFFDTFFQKYYREMTKEEKEEVVQRLEAEYKAKYGKDIKVGTEEHIPGVLFGYALDLSRCIGCRRCVYACVTENNQSRNPQIHYIQVLRFRRGTSEGEHWIAGASGVSNLEESVKYYDPPLVPQEEHFYMPVQCQQCENPPCVKACPTQATYKTRDGIVVVDYNWCIGCRYCMAACPYDARKLNWAEPYIPKEQINPVTHYLGNRPRMKGCVEKCFFCIQRVRAKERRYPACVEICPVGARKFGNLLDPSSEIRYIMAHERVFRLKEELNTSPKFFYFFSI